MASIFDDDFNGADIEGGLDSFNDFLADDSEEFDIEESDDTEDLFEDDSFDEDEDDEEDMYLDEDSGFFDDIEEFGDGDSFE